MISPSTTSLLWALASLFSLIPVRSFQPLHTTRTGIHTCLPIPRLSSTNLHSSAEDPGRTIKESSTSDQNENNSKHDNVNGQEHSLLVNETLMDLVPEVDPDSLTKEEFLEINSDCMAYDSESDTCLPAALLRLPSHSNDSVNNILKRTEAILQSLHRTTEEMGKDQQLESEQTASDGYEYGPSVESVFANNYVDLGKIDVVGFDYDYTLVTYTDDLLELIYEKALQRLVKDRQYPSEMLFAGMQYDPFFSIRGLAVDKETGWITHLSYTHKVAVAWEGREKLPTSRLFEEYRVKRALNPQDRKKRLKPLNDLFSMAECCLIADTIQFFKDRDIPYSPRNVINDCIRAVTEAHISGDFHRLVANNPEKYFTPTPHLKQVLGNFKEAGKRLIFVSNSPFWYVDAGMRYIFGPEWRKEWDAIITSKCAAVCVFCGSAVFVCESIPIDSCLSP